MTVTLQIGNIFLRDVTQECKQLIFSPRVENMAVVLGFMVAGPSSLCLELDRLLTRGSC